MQPFLLTFNCERIHYFINSHYTVNITEGNIQINKFKSQHYKYLLPICYETKIYWYVEQNKIQAFGILNKNIVKFFKAQPKDLEKLRKLLGGKVIFEGIVEFYKCLRQIGEGADSKVFRVEDNTNKNNWALKCFERRDDFYQEIITIQNLDHPNIIQYKEYFQGEQYFYVIMELMNGQTLAKCLEKNLITTHQQCKIVIKGILNAIVHLKQKGIVHRDIKPANIMFSQSSRYETVKICDFNYAIKEQDQHIQHIPYGLYTAPEALYDPPIFSHKMDVYSCGAILYRLYAGEEMHSHRYLQDRNQFVNHLSQKKINYQALEKASTPTYAIELIKAMLQFDPDQRISAEEALTFDYFQNDSLSPLEKKTRFQNRIKQTNGKFTLGTSEFETNPEADAKSAQVRRIQIHHNTHNSTTY